MNQLTNRLSLLALILSGAVFVACSTGGGDDYAESMKEEHAEDTAEPSPAAEVEPAGAIETRSVVYASFDGADVTGYLAQPIGAEPGTPGVIVIQEWWGLNDNIRSMADQLAGEGYIALAVDLYQGEVADNRDKAFELMQAANARTDENQSNLEAAQAYLTGELGAGDTGSVGWCFGGGMSLLAALALPSELDASVIYYGRVETDREILSGLETPILGHFAVEDQGIPVDTVREFEAALEELGKPATIHYYEGADHAFANPTGNAYDAEAAELAWERTLEFFDTELSDAAATGETTSESDAT